MGRPNRPPDLNTVGGRIKWMRLQQGWTQYQLADRAGVHPSTVAHWEVDHQAPDADSADVLCDLFGCERWMLGAEVA
jgi:transcriptional regulator with XRE-family HTH domain